MGEINEKYQYLSLNQKSFRCLKYNKEQESVGEYLKLLWLIKEACINNDGIEYLVILEKFKKQFKEIPKKINLEYLLNSLSSLVGDKKITNQDEFVNVLKNTKILARENTHDITEQIKKYVELNYMVNFGINQVAEQLCLTPNYLSSLFHKITGIYFSDYLNSYRLEKAKKILLSNSSASIKDIAMMVGYSNARYFSSLFKQSFGMLPSSYRKMYLDK
jgi:YesN/AraC family two-component response regulator